MDKTCLSTVLIACLLSSAPLFGSSSSKNECAPQNLSKDYAQCPMPCGPLASIQVANSSGSQNDFFLTASYTYWLAEEEGLELGRSGDFVLGDDPSFPPSTTILSQPTEYQSGFKVGVGYERNDWVLSGEYTWVRNHTSQNSFAPSASSELFTGVWLIAPWFVQEAGDGGSLHGLQITSKWDLEMDLAQLLLSRPYYQSSRFIITPFGGIQSAWIRQKMTIDLFETPGIISPLPAQPIHSFSGSNSWAIGPKLGSLAEVLLVHGFRMEGNLALSLLFTDYTKIFHREDASSITDPPSNMAIEIRNKTALRSVIEAGLGLGWGRYFQSNRYHIDFLAKYDLMYWWNQNMMREMLNFLWREIPTNGDLSLSGLTVTARLDF